MAVVLRRLVEADVPAVVSLALEAWQPVFASMERALGPAVFARLYPDWRAAHAAAVAAECRDPGARLWIAEADGAVAGFVAVRATTEDAAAVGEIEMIAVAPGHRGQGLGDALMARGLQAIRDMGLTLAVIATGGDEGHAPARALYERHGFAPFPLVRYYRPL